MVEDGLVEGDRDVVGGGEPDGAGQLLVGHGRQVDDPDDDPGAGEADPHVAGAEPGLAPQLADGRPDRGGVLDLAVADRAGREGNLPDPGDDGPGARGCPPGLRSPGAPAPGTFDDDLDDADRGGPDVEAERALGHEFALSAVSAVAEVALDVRPADAEVFPDAYSREVSCLDQAVDRHV